MVQKGFGWLRRVTAKAVPDESVAYLQKIGARAPRLGLRTACEPLSPVRKELVLAKQVQ